MNYVRSSFQIWPGSGDGWSDNWDRIFGKKMYRTFNCPTDARGGLECCRGLPILEDGKCVGEMHHAECHLNPERTADGK